MSLLSDERQHLASTQFCKLALFFSVYDDNFYLTNNYSRLITLALLGQKT